MCRSPIAEWLTKKWLAERHGVRVQDLEQAGYTVQSRGERIQHDSLHLTRYYVADLLYRIYHCCLLHASLGYLAQTTSYSQHLGQDPRPRRGQKLLHHSPHLSLVALRFLFVVRQPSHVEPHLPICFRLSGQVPTVVQLHLRPPRILEGSVLPNPLHPFPEIKTSPFEQESPLTSNLRGRRQALTGSRLCEKITAWI